MYKSFQNKLKIPGMLYISISFVPWITYWILCGMGNKSGIFFSFIIALVILLPQIYRREFNLMDLTSILYFSIAIVVTFIFEINVFVEGSGGLGYLVLFMMALFSILIKKPYTLQVSKRDYPEVYWREKSFLLINNLITFIWAMIFLSNSIIFFFLNMPFNIVFSNFLIVFGIISSIIVPMKISAYYVIREFKKYDWNILVDPHEKKSENEYDVIIVGSGIGGLTCGALLSKRGYKILILEQHYMLGGYCSSFQRKGFVFNTGVGDVSGLWEKGPITYILEELGLKKDDLFVRNRIRYLFKGKEIDADDLDSFIRLLSEMFPEEKENIHVFFDEAKKAYEECYREADMYGTPLPGELIVKVFGEKKLFNYPREHSHFYDWMNKTYKEKLDEYFNNDDLKTLLCGLLGYIGTSPEKTPASRALTACVSYYLYGGYFIKGGALNFAESLRKVIEKHGGKVLLKHKVDEILVENGEVRGVRVGEKVFKSRIIVANVNAKTTFLELVGEDKLSREFIEYIKSLKMSPSCFMVFLGVDMDLSTYPTIIQNLDEKYGIIINSNADPTLAPEGKASLTILTLANYRDFPNKGTKEYLEKKKALANKLIKKAERIIPGLSKHIIVIDAATPKTFEEYTFMPEGAIYAFDQSIDTKRPYFKTPIKGLYLASASTFPGGGIEAVVISGIICANDICGWKIPK